jgi:signal transduction histidine kinase
MNAPTRDILAAATTDPDEETAAIAAAVRAERERLAAELHDGVIQSLYALGLGLEATINTLDTDVPLARTRLIQSRDTINNVIQEIRHYVADLLAERTLAPPPASRPRSRSAAGPRSPRKGGTSRR